MNASFISCFRAKVGKIVILNGTDYDWIITVCPNITGKFDEEEKEVHPFLHFLQQYMVLILFMEVIPNVLCKFFNWIQIEGPSIPLPIVGSISLGAYKYKRGKVELKEPEDGNEQHWVKIRGHE